MHPRRIHAGDFERQSFQCFLARKLGEVADEDCCFPCSLLRFPATDGGRPPHYRSILSRFDRSIQSQKLFSVPVKMAPSLLAAVSVFRTFIFQNGVVKCRRVSQTSLMLKHMLHSLFRCCAIISGEIRKYTATSTQPDRAFCEVHFRFP